jgi:hypothetical protein
MGLDTRTNATLWKDRAVVEVNVAVMYSFQVGNRQGRSPRFTANGSLANSPPWTWIMCAVRKFKIYLKTKPWKQIKLTVCNYFINNVKVLMWYFSGSGCT